MEPQYSGGMVLNPELEHGLNGWTPFGDTKLEHEEAEDGNKYIVTSDRSGHQGSFLQKFHLEEEKLYVLSDYTLHITYLQIRKRQVKFQVVDSQGLPFENGKISVKQIQQTFPFGNAVSKFILENKAYQELFLSGFKYSVFDNEMKWYSTEKGSGKVNYSESDTMLEFAKENNILVRGHNILWDDPRFKYTVFENEMKWYSTEKGPGKVNYSESDTMLKFAKENNILVRGHNVLWDDPRYQPSWVKRLPRKDLPLATEKRMKSIMKHYSGQVFHWDVINENLHFSYYEERMGRNSSATFLQMAHQVDQKAIPFLNDYSTIERPSDTCATPAMYLEKIKLIREQGYHGPLGIGLESHFDTPNLPYVRASLDMLASTKLPIWITELDVSRRPKQALYLTQLIKEFHAHPAIHGIIMWGSMSTKGCWKMCFTDKNFSNLPTGNALDNIMKVWRHEGLLGTTDAYGYFNTSLFHGDYEVEIRHTTENYSKIRQLGMEPSDKIQEAHFKFHV
ncbi:endo-1,4-beta-xylanase-like [Olea europaea subsp. europaea]|uniref:Endo-1,4-beta-xylanase-like, partial n=1 Tax=Olea europaea subsp. europaea TaxID=158383 RepID=A0A8S0QNT3_OLEEU|nr:endo-1,4-beta-xylanase-like [Olea europaea subsp. europaea]